MWREALAVAGRARTAAVADEEATSELALEVLQSGRHGGLGDMELLRSSDQAAGANDLQKGTGEFNVHGLPGSDRLERQLILHLISELSITWCIVIHYYQKNPLYILVPTLKLSNGNSSCRLAPRHPVYSPPNIGSRFNSYCARSTNSRHSGSATTLAPKARMRLHRLPVPHASPSSMAAKRVTERGLQKNSLIVCNLPVSRSK